ncbi:MAG: septal ring lytic transglycosylase RlpA family protein [Pseudomonadales bacterium]|nr:septal ring lytic transglycosylase RlpA family protein [Pseudomonadales bacterium]
MIKRNASLTAKYCAVLAIVLGVFGCSQYQRDGAPSGPLELDEIEPVTAKYEPRSRGGNRNPYTVLGKTYQLLPTNQQYREQGIASWYGTKFHGRKTANGERYDMRALSAAHRSLPIPTYLKVTNLSNNRSVVVRVNDRGPFHSDRIIDLSFGAASMLGFANQGTANVLLESIDFPEAKLSSASTEPAAANHYLQVGAFSSERSAQMLKQKIEQLVVHAVEIKHNDAQKRLLYRVFVGPFNSLDVLASVKQKLYFEGVKQSHRVPAPIL